MRVVLTALAAADVADAAEWYESKGFGFAGRFLDQFEVLTDRLAENPL